ncbi:hypothetical protein CDIK_4184, partial [Cucumispora dikerogammari]
TTGFGRSTTRRAPRLKLEAFFLLVANDTTARKYTYVQMPAFYRWLEDTRKWVKRKRTATIQIGRIYPAPKPDTEKRALPLLLTHVPGPLGFLDLQTFNRTDFDSFASRCIARRLLPSEDGYEIIVREVATLHRLRQLQVSFKNILIFGLRRSRIRFEELFIFLSEDYQTHIPLLDRLAFIFPTIKNTFDVRLKNVPRVIPHLGFYENFSEPLIPNIILENEASLLNRGQSVI